MDINENYYIILGVNHNSTKEEIKKSYYKLSFTHHPDKGGDAETFDFIKRAYDVLYNDEKRSLYDKRSKWGKSYDESSEYLDYEFSNTSKMWDDEKFQKWKEKNKLNIVVYVDESFDGSIEYTRWILCKKCGGDGKSIDEQIQIKDASGKVLKYFHGSDICEFCEGEGKWNNRDCQFCGGKGKVGFSNCKTCNGEKRILGKQKVTNISIPETEKAHKIPNMGNASPNEIGKWGDLWVVKKETT